MLLQDTQSSSKLIKMFQSIKQLYKKRAELIKIFKMVQEIEL